MNGLHATQLNVMHMAEEEVVLGSLMIKFPLKDLDDALDKSTKDYFLLASLMTLLLVMVLIILTNEKIKKPLYALIRASESVAKGIRAQGPN